jgi:hypothetical protein
MKQQSWCYWWHHWQLCLLVRTFPAVNHYTKFQQITTEWYDCHEKEHISKYLYKIRLPWKGIIPWRQHQNPSLTWFEYNSVQSHKEGSTMLWMSVASLQSWHYNSNNSSAYAYNRRNTWQHYQGQKPASRKCVKKATQKCWYELEKLAHLHKRVKWKMCQTISFQR